LNGAAPILERALRHSVPATFPNRINIDTGAFATGRLTCVVLGGLEPRFLATA
jgi:hypothetical protein